MPRILAYNLSAPKAELIRSLCVTHGIEFVTVQRGDQPRRIHEMLAARPADGAAVGETFDDEMLLFDGIGDDLLHVLLREIRRGGGVALKAVVTPFNRVWTSFQLRNELLREQQEMMKQLANGRGS